MNFGAGNLSLQRRRRAEVGQALAEQSRTVNETRGEIAAARGACLAETSRIEMARRQVKTAGSGFAEDLVRIKATQAPPIEAIDSLNLLKQARLELIDAVTRLNAAQFRLFVALGSPPLQNLP